MHRLFPPLILLTLITAAPASAATVPERSTERFEAAVEMSGQGCTTPVARSVRLPAGTVQVSKVSVRVGDRLDDGVYDHVATVTAVEVLNDRIRVTAIGAGSSCEPGFDQIPWTAAELDVTASVVVRRRVLTRGTVIRRGDRACLARVPRIRSLTDRLENLPEDYTGYRRGIRVLNQLASTYRGMARAVDPPSAERSRRGVLERYVDTLKLMGDSLENAAVSVEEFDVDAADYHSRKFGQRFDRADRAARRYGFRVCGDIAKRL